MCVASLAGVFSVPALWHHSGGFRLNVRGTNQHLPAFLATLAHGNANRIHSFNSLITVILVIFPTSKYPRENGSGNKYFHSPDVFLHALLTKIPNTTQLCGAIFLFTGITSVEVVVLTNMYDNKANNHVSQGCALLFQTFQFSASFCYAFLMSL